MHAEAGAGWGGRAWGGGVRECSREGVEDTVHIIWATETTGGGGGEGGITGDITVLHEEEGGRVEGLMCLMVAFCLCIGGRRASGAW